MSAQRKTDILCGDRQHGTAEKPFQELGGHGNQLT